MNATAVERLNAALSRCRIDAELGEGGMATVYAWQRLDRGLCSTRRTGFYVNGDRRLVAVQVEAGVEFEVRGTEILFDLGQS